jgi:hypothetical protein
MLGYCSTIHFTFTQEEVRRSLGFLWGLCAFSVSSVVSLANFSALTLRTLRLRGESSVDFGIAVAPSRRSMPCPAHVLGTPTPFISGFVGAQSAAADARRNFLAPARHSALVSGTAALPLERSLNGLSPGHHRTCTLSKDFPNSTSRTSRCSAT